MAKETPETSAFTSVGGAAFPPTYEDNKKTAEVSTWPTPVIVGKIALYESFLEREDIMPRARKVAGRVLTHLKFEDEYRVNHSDLDT